MLRGHTRTFSALVIGYFLVVGRHFLVSLQTSLWILINEPEKILQNRSSFWVIQPKEPYTHPTIGRLPLPVTCHCLCRTGLLPPEPCSQIVLFCNSFERLLLGYSSQVYTKFVKKTFYMYWNCSELLIFFYRARAGLPLTSEYWNNMSCRQSAYKEALGFPVHAVTLLHQHTKFWRKRGAHRTKADIEKHCSIDSVSMWNWGRLPWRPSALLLIWSDRWNGCITLHVRLSKSGW